MNVSNVQFLLGKDHIFCVHSSTLTAQGTDTIRLDYLETKVLQQLCGSANTLVPYENLFSLWQNRYVGDAVLTRVVSSLRTKLKVAGCDALEIQNRSKRGYILKGDIVRGPFSKTRPVKRQFSRVVKLCATMFFVVLIWQVSELRSMQLDNIQSSELTLIESFNTPAVHNVKQLTSAPNGEHFTYIRNRDNGRRTQLVLFNRQLQTSIPLAQFDDISSPFWYADNQLLFQARTNNTCYINLLKFNPSLTQFEQTNLFKCDTKNPIIGLSRLKDDIVVIQQRQPEYAQLSILSLTGEPTEYVEFKSLRNTKIYQAVSDANSGQLFLFTSRDHLTSEIYQTAKQNNWQLNWHYKLSSFVQSAFWQDEQLSFATNNNRYSIIYFKDSDATSITTQFHDDTFDVINKVGDAWLTLNNTPSKKTLTRIDRKSLQRTSLLNFADDLNFVGRLSDGRFIFQDNSNQQAKLIACSPTSYLFSDYVFLDSNLSLSSLQETQKPRMVTLQYPARTQIGRVEHKMFHQSHSIGSQKARIAGESVYFIATESKSQTLYKTSIYPTTQSLTPITSAALFTTIKDQGLAYEVPVFSHVSKLGLWTNDDGETRLLVNTEESVIKLLSDGSALYFQLQNGKHFLSHNGQTHQLELRYTDNIVAFDENYLFAVNDVATRSTVSIYK